jgi:hypothetical protein
MPEIEFYFNPAEQRQCIEFIFSKGAVMIPDMFYAKMQAVFIHNIQEYDALVYDAIHFPIVRYYISHQSFTKFPFKFSLIKREEGEVYSISLEYGGPVIDITPSRINDTILIVGGSIHHYPYVYIKEDFTQTEAASEEIKLFYKDMVRYIKTNSKPLKEHKRIYRIGKQTIEDLKRGMKLANIEPERWRNLIN